MKKKLIETTIATYGTGTYLFLMLLDKVHFKVTLGLEMEPEPK